MTSHVFPFEFFISFIVITGHNIVMDAIKYINFYLCIFALTFSLYFQYYVDVYCHCIIIPGLEH